jgi:hypothetical protein
MFQGLGLGFKESRSQGFEVSRESRPRGYKVPRFQVFMVLRVLGLKISGFQGI